MPRAYSVDLRERVVGFVGKGHSCRAAARHFGVSVTFAIVLMRRYRATKTLSARPSGGARRDGLLRHLEVLVGWIKAEPGMTLAEMSERLLSDHGVTSTQSGLSKLLRRSGYTYKKIHAGQRGRAWAAPATAA
jgi:transposase